MFRRRKRDQYHDEVSEKLMRSGVYSVDNGPSYQAFEGSSREEKPMIRKERPILAGTFYVFFISMLLWWIPLFGQMIAGYIGGRKAGGPFKGILVTIIPALIMIALLACFDLGFLPFLGAVFAFPSFMIEGVRSNLPSVGNYLAGMYIGLKSIVGVDANGFFILVIFGLIGGIMADQNKREIINVATSHLGIVDMFERSGAHLNKFADIIAERVLWTLSTVENGGRSLVGRMHWSSPTPMVYEHLQKLPPAGYGSYSEPYQQQKSHSGYEYLNSTPIVSNDYQDSGWVRREEPSQENLETQSVYDFTLEKDEQKSSAKRKENAGATKAKRASKRATNNIRKKQDNKGFEMPPFHPDPKDEERNPYLEIESDARRTDSTKRGQKKARASSKRNIADDTEFIASVQKARQEKSKRSEFKGYGKGSKRDRMAELLNRAAKFDKLRKNKDQSEQNLYERIEIGGDKKLGNEEKNGKGNRNTKSYDRL